MTKEVKQNNVNKVKEFMSKYNFYLSVLSKLKTQRPSQICSSLNITKQRLNYYLTRLKDLGYVRKIGYGVWEVTEKEVKETDLERSLSMSRRLKTIRSHGFGFYLKIPKIFRWIQREEYLKKENIQYKLDNLKQGQQIDFHGFHIFLYAKGIRLVQKEGFEGIFTDSATFGNEIAIRRILRVIKSLERLFNTSLSIRNQYNIKITRQHHALIKNELASLYNKDGRKLHIFDEKGLWLLIDNSFNLDEIETVRGSSADKDMDNVVKVFFNDMKDYNKKTGETPTFSTLVSTMSQVVDNQAFHEANIKSHVLAIQQNTQTAEMMSQAVQKLTDTVQKIEEKIK